jgi:hypothetical protein
VAYLGLTITAVQSEGGEAGIEPDTTGEIKPGGPSRHEPTTGSETFSDTSVENSPVFLRRQIGAKDEVNSARHNYNLALIISFSISFSPIEPTSAVIYRRTNEANVIKRSTVLLGGRSIASPHKKPLSAE